MTVFRCIKRGHRLPLIKRTVRKKQSGAALIAAIFIITGLAALGGLMTQFLILGTEETIDEWYSAQALYAAESGVEWSVYQNGASGANQTVATDAWFDVVVTTTNFGGSKTLYTITSTGKAGGTSGSPRAKRQIVVQYMP